MEIMGMEIPTKVTDYKRVLQKASTPDSEEFWRISGIAGAGIAFAGAIGFTIFVLMSIIPM